MEIRNPSNIPWRKILTSTSSSKEDANLGIFRLISSYMYLAPPLNVGASDQAQRGRTYPQERRAWE